MARGGTPSPEPEVVARAMHLHRTRPEMTLRQIAAEIGVRSPTTVSNYLAIGQNSETWFPHVKRAEVGRHLNLVYATVMDRLLRRLDDPETEPEKVAAAIVAVGKELARMHGLYAPTNVNANVNIDPAMPDPETTAAIQSVLAELEREERNSDGTY